MGFPDTQELGLSKSYPQLPGTLLGHRDLEVMNHNLTSFFFSFLCFSQMATMLKLDILDEREFITPHLNCGSIFEPIQYPHNILNKTAPRKSIAKTTTTRSCFPTFLPNQAFAGVKP